MQKSELYDILSDRRAHGGISAPICSFNVFFQTNQGRRIPHESKIIRKTDLREMQGHQEKRIHQNHLWKSEAQTASGIILAVICWSTHVLPNTEGRGVEKSGRIFTWRSWQRIPKIGKAAYNRQKRLGVYRGTPIRSDGRVPDRCIPFHLAASASDVQDGQTFQIKNKIPNQI